MGMGIGGDGGLCPDFMGHGTNEREEDIITTFVSSVKVAVTGRTCLYGTGALNGSDQLDGSDSLTSRSHTPSNLPPTLIMADRE